MNKYAPIALFVYNRPRHARRTLEALAKNPEAAHSELYVFADGPPHGATDDTLEAVAGVRRVIRERQWCGQVEIVESERNLGLAESIIGGVSRLCERFGRVIVLEDDLDTSPGFLHYMNAALDLYQDDSSVFQISGFMVRAPLLARSTGFLRVSTSWGWATWARAWGQLRTDSSTLRQEIEARDKRHAFDLDGASFHFEELRRNEDGELKTWAVKWYASIFLAGGLCLYPKRSLVRNFGFDGSGNHCENDSSGYFRKLPMASRVKPRRIRIFEDPQYLGAMQRSFNYRLQLWTGTRLRDRLARRLNRIWQWNGNSPAKESKPQKNKS